MDSWRHREAFKGPIHKFFICSHVPWGPAKGREAEWSGPEMLEERLGTVALGRELREQLPGSRCWLIPHIATAILLRQTPLSERHQTQGKQQPHPQVILCPTLWCLCLTADYRVTKGFSPRPRSLVVWNRLTKACSDIWHYLTPSDITRGGSRKKKQW